MDANDSNIQAIEEGLRQNSSQQAGQPAASPVLVAALKRQKSPQASWSTGGQPSSGGRPHRYGLSQGVGGGGVEADQQ